MRNLMHQNVPNFPTVYWTSFGTFPYIIGTFLISDFS
jgi:hypothetical protein